MSHCPHVNSQDFPSSRLSKNDSRILKTSFIKRQTTNLFPRLQGAVYAISKDSVKLQYYEDGVLKVTETDPQEGSYANLGLYPHWCLGNIHQCPHGITVDFWINVAPVTEDSPEVVLFTSGGNFYFSDGLYLIQRFGDQYEFGVSKQEHVWKINFRLFADTWVKVHAEWDVSEGLMLVVDNSEWSQTTPVRRDYFPGTFDSFAEVVTGLTSDGMIIDQDELFKIRHIIIHDRRINSTIEDDSFVQTLAYPGCVPETSYTGNFIPMDLAGEEHPIESCRSMCNAAIILMKNGSFCSCAGREILSEIDTRNGSCDSSSVWQVFSASGVAEENPYSMTVSVRTLQTRDYVKPMETVIIEIKPNHIAKTSYEVDCGDGVTFVTHKTSINYFWRSAGKHTITVRSRVGILSFESYFSFEVLDVDENTAPEMVVLFGAHDETHQFHGSFELFLTDLANISRCDVAFGDSNQLSYDFKDQYFYHEEFQHIFNTFGQYIVSAHCKNNYGVDSSSLMFLSKRFDVPFYHKVLGDAFEVPLAGGQAFVADIGVVRNYDKPVNVHKTDNNITVPATLLKPFENIISLELNGEIFHETMFFMENIPANASILPDYREGAWNLTTNISVVVPPGNNMFVTCTFGLGEEESFFIYEATEPVTFPFEVEYENLGYYPLHVIVSNDLGKTEVEDLISVEVPIVSIVLTVSNITNKEDPVILGVVLNDGIDGPDKVTFEIDHDDGNVLPYTYRSHSKFFTQYNNSYVYRDWGIYTICVSASNSISRVMDCALVQVGKNITYMDLQTTTTGRVSTSQYAEINITVLTGSDITYHVDFGDEHPFTFTDRDLLTSENTESSHLIRRKRETSAVQADPADNSSFVITTVLPNFNTSETTEEEVAVSRARSFVVRGCSCIVTVRHLYSTVGYYEVKANISNVFSSASAVLCPYIIVDDSDDTMCGDTVVEMPGYHTSRDNPYVHIRSTPIDIDIQAQSPNCGGNGYEYTWKAVNIVDNLEVPYTDLCKLEQTDNIFTIPAVSLEFGMYKLVTTVSPIGYKRKANQKEIYIQIIPSNPIATFKGDPSETFFSNGILTLDFSESHDPDLTSNIRQGVEYDLICFQREAYDAFSGMTFENFLEGNITQLLIEDVIYESETMNPLRIYQYENCLTDLDDFVNAIMISNGRVTTSTSYFVATETVFSLIVSKEGRISTVSKVIRMEYDNFEEQMNMLANAANLKDTGKALDIVNKIGTGGARGNDSDAQEKQDQLKELALTVVAAVTNYATNTDQVNRVVSTCSMFTAEKSTDTAREKAAGAINNTGDLIKTKFANQDNTALESTLGDQVQTLSNVAPTGEAEKKEEKKTLRCKRRADPDAPDEDTESATHYDALIKSKNLMANAILRDLYDFLFHHYAEFRTAVRKRIDNVKLPQAVLKEDPVKLFLRLGLEWDPFDIQNVILDACEIELDLSIKRTKEADKMVQAGSAGAVSSMSGLVLKNFEKERCRRRRRRRSGTSTPEDEAPLAMKVTSEGISLNIEMGENPNALTSKVAKQKRKKVSVDPCSVHDAEYEAELAASSTASPVGVVTPANSGTSPGATSSPASDQVVTSTRTPIGDHDDITDGYEVGKSKYTTQLSVDDGNSVTHETGGADEQTHTESSGGTGTDSGTDTSGTNGQTDTGSSGGSNADSSGGTDSETDTSGTGGQSNTGTSGGSNTDSSGGTDSGTDTSGTGGQTDSGTSGGSNTDSSGDTGTDSGTDTSGTGGQTDTGSSGGSNTDSSGGTGTDSGTNTDNTGGQTGTGSSGGTDSGTDGQTNSGTDEEQDFTEEAGTGTVNAVNKNNPYTYGSNSARVTSEVSSINLVDPALGEPIKVEDSEEEMPILINSKCAVPVYNATIRQVRDAPPVSLYHSITMANNGSSLHFRITARENWDMTKFRICLVYNASTVDPPCIHEAIMPLGEDVFPEIREQNYSHWMELRNTYFPPQNYTPTNGDFTVSVSLEKGHVDFRETVTEVVYDYQLWTSGCLFWDTTTESFIGNGTRVSNLTTPEVTVCMTNHLTSFGGDFAVPPNTIDFTNVWAKFKNLNENAAVFSTVISLIGLYIIIMIWARYKDKKDIQKWGASPLDDNLPTDNYHYQVTVQTGVRKLAATNSAVSFILSGEECDTGVRRLYDGRRKTFVRGSIMNYILSVENCLGSLNFLRIWHDNTGKGKMRSWYLDQIQVTDLQTGDRYFFLCDRWLAVEEDDGMVDRILPVAGLEDLAAFKQLFSSSVKKKLTNDHIWFSVFSRPTRSNFTRVQRISCCVSLLFMTMITNAMWFKSEENNANTSAMKIGPVSFTLQQVFVSFASTMIVFPVNFILMTFFRKCRPKKNGVMHKNQQVPKRGKWKSVSATQSQTWNSVPMKSRWQRFKESITNFINFQRHKSKYQSEPDPDECVREMKIAGIPESAQKKKKRKKKPGTLPHWCIYIAWVLCFFSITSSGFFTILYSMEWGPEKANEWLTTFLMSFFQSVIVVQPIKVFCLVAFIACVLKKPDLSDEDPGEDLNNVIAAHDEEFMAKSNTAIDEIALRRKVQNSEFKPPDVKTLEEQRQLRMMELKMEEVVREIGIYALFVLILFFLSYQTRDSDSFLMAENLKTTLGSGFEKISTVSDYWNWLENKLIPNLYATQYSDGSEIKPWWDKRCIKDMESRRVGLPRLRQLRVKEDTCVVNPKLSTIIKHCRDEYGWTDDDAKHYLPGWVKPPKENITALREEKSPWIYQNSIQLKSAPYIGTISTYKGGGYVAMFERNVTWTKRIVEQLKKDVWLDVYTRGVFLEFAVYNPNINLFSSAILLTEFISSGGAVARIEFKVFRLLNYVGGFGILVMIFQVIYACFSLYFFVRCIKKLRKEKMKYFARFWNLLEFILLCFCIAVIAMYAFKQILSELTMRALKDPDKADYVNFQSMAMYDELFGWMMACVVFLATVQFLKLLQFNKKMNMLGDTIKVATKDLKVFSIAFALYFFAFTACGHLLFGTSILAYSSLLGSAESMFAFTLGSFDFAAMADVNKVLGPLFFFTFVGVVYVGLMSMFFTIIGDAFTEVKANVEQSTNDYEIVSFMWKRIKAVLGLT
ncbi:uncharacterized protein LOC132547416 [Ylistrum balloti]|uniref:uncharacterized protein LOC132547416 n=1 Tax=Ylistrum balloti TaxID=509963 RepID=UPI002905ACA3|nr:uncharacterized protein LOC132547416 [Ylistrum balloti]